MIRNAALGLLLLAACSLSFGQSNVLSVERGATLQAKAGTTVEGKLTLRMSPGYHCNSNTPLDAYLIPLRLTWNPGPVEALTVQYPKPQMEKTSFQENPLSVFSGTFEVTTRFKVPANAPAGPNAVTGKLRYQACNDRMCLRPQTINVSLPLVIVK